jgi:hypothetical protein
MVVEAFRNVPQDDWEFLLDRSLSGRLEIESYQSIVSELVFARRGMQLVH